MIWWIVLLLILPFHLEAQEFEGEGPLPARNFQPIQQIFLNLPFERAQVLAPGRWRLYVESAESNEIATNQGRVEAALKFEQNRTVLGGAIGVHAGWEAGMEVPFLSRFGGFLDPPIDFVEDLFGLSNVERKMWPDNSFGAYSVDRDGKPLFRGQRQYMELGDISFFTKHAVWQPEVGPRVSLRAAVKAPTGRSSSMFGSGKMDFGLGLAAEQQALSWLVVYANVALIYPMGPITPQRLTLNPIVTQGLAVEGQLGKGFSVVFQQGMYTSPFHGLDTRVLEGTVVELALGLNWRCADFLFQLGGIENVSGVAQAADFTLLARLVFSPRYLDLAL